MEHLYHFTPCANIQDIQADGLDPSRSQEPGFRERSIYLACDIDHAAGYVFHQDSGQGVILAVHRARLDPALLGPDDVDLPAILEQDGDGRDWRDIPFEESLLESGQCTYSGIIPARELSVVARVEEDGCVRAIEPVALLEWGTPSARVRARGMPR